MSWPGRLNCARQDLLGQRHADGVGDALAQRAGGGLDAGGVAVFRVARGLAVQLAEVLQVVDGQIVAGEVQQA
jgi:hypothetical protein